MLAWGSYLININRASELKLYLFALMLIQEIKLINLKNISLSTNLIGYILNIVFDVV